MTAIRQLSRQRAFTLIELLVVILILAVLIAVAAPSFLGQQNKAHDSAAKQTAAVAYRDGKAIYVSRGRSYQPLGTAADAPSGADDASLFAQLKSSEPQLEFSTRVQAGNPNRVQVDVPAANAATYSVLSRSGTVFCVQTIESGELAGEGPGVYWAWGPAEADSPCGADATGGAHPNGDSCDDVGSCPLPVPPPTIDPEGPAEPEDPHSDPGDLPEDEDDTFGDHVYRGSGMFQPCEDDCSDLWAQETASTDKDLAQELLDIRQEVGVMPSMCGIMGDSYSDWVNMQAAPSQHVIQFSGPFSSSQRRTIRYVLAVPASPTALPWGEAGSSKSMRCMRQGNAAVGTTMPEDGAVLYRGANWFEATRLDGTCGITTDPGSQFERLDGPPYGTCYRPYTDDVLGHSRLTLWYLGERKLTETSAKDWVPGDAWNKSLYNPLTDPGRAVVRGRVMDALHSGRYPKLVAFYNTYYD